MKVKITIQDHSGKTSNLSTIIDVSVLENILETAKKAEAQNPKDTLPLKNDKGGYGTMHFEFTKPEHLGQKW